MSWDITYHPFFLIVLRHFSLMWRSLCLVIWPISLIILDDSIFLVIPVFSSKFSLVSSALSRIYYCYLSSSSAPNARIPKFRDQPSFPVTQYIRKHMNYLDSRRIGAMHESGVPSTIPDLNVISLLTAVGAWNKEWLHCRVRGMSVSRWISLKSDRLFVYCF